MGERGCRGMGGSGLGVGWPGKGHGLGRGGYRRWGEGPVGPEVGGLGCGHRCWEVASNGAHVASDSGKVANNGEDWGRKGKMR